MAERTLKGRMSMTVVDAETQRVVEGGKHHQWKGETLAQSRAVNARLGQAIKDAAEGNMFTSEFNPGADGRTFEVHFVSHSFYEDTGEPEASMDFTKYDLDSEEVKLFGALFDLLK